MPYFTDVTSQTYYTQPPTNMTSEERTVTTTNRMLLSYDDEYYTYATGVKTGSLNESGYCISATATYDGYSYLVVCMGSRISTARATISIITAKCTMPRRCSAGHF